MGPFIPVVFLMMTVFSGVGATPVDSPGSALPGPQNACSWEIASSPNASPERNLLRDVAILGSEAWAVGEYDAILGPEINLRTLTMRWDGTAWSLVASPNVGIGWNVLEGVAALGPGELWAVGWSAPTTSGGEPQTLTLSGDGQTWTVVESPVITGGSELLAIDSEGGETWAVGDRAGPGDGSTGVSTLAIRPSGSSWEVVPTPDLGSARNHLYAVDVVGPADAWAVGRWRDVGQTSRTFAIHWDGASWTHVPTPNLGLDDTLWDVEGASADDVWAVGSFHNGTDYEAMTLHWDGSEWTAVANPGGGNAVAVVTADDAWAMGVNVTHWDGSAWTPVPTPDLAGNLGAMEVVGPCDGWAVGRTIDAAGVFTTLTWRLTRAPNGFVDQAGSGGVRPGPVIIGLGAGPREVTAVKPPLAFPMEPRAWSA